jgi:hypothetical protein
VAVSQDVSVCASLNRSSPLAQVVPCNVDIATVAIIHDARQADPQGQRTIGVLTKPDLIPRVRGSREPTTCKCRIVMLSDAQ